jgi:hypothetical protein
MAMAGTWRGEERYSRIGGNIGDWLYGRSLLSQGDRANPDAGDFGLIGWNDVPNYYGAIHGYNAYYADDIARGMLGMIRAAAALKTDRWNERLAQCLLATMRLTSRRGFSPVRIDGPLAAESWRSRFEGELSTFSPHDQAYLQACHLWAYRQTADRLFLDRATSALRLSMEAYPDQWSWTNGQITLQRARLLLPLAWLVRVDDTPEHRDWLARMVNDLLADQVECGAIRSRIVASPTSNGTYGNGETALVDHNGDPASDLLYEANFACSACARRPPPPATRPTARLRTGWRSISAGSRPAAPRIRSSTAPGTVASTTVAGTTGAPMATSAGDCGRLKLDGHRASCSPR